MTVQCAGCDRFIRGTAEDPVISAKSLGWGNYHEACAQAEWKRRGISGKERVVPKEKKTQFRVDCVLVEHGVPSDQWCWCFLEPTMAEAERVCSIAMSSHQNLPGHKDDTTNTTSARYVNCTITLVLKNGKKTVLDERIHPLAPGSGGTRSVEDGTYA